MFHSVLIILDYSQFKATFLCCCNGNL